MVPVAGHEVPVHQPVVVGDMDVADVAAQFLDAERQHLLLGVLVRGVEDDAQVVVVDGIEQAQERFGVRGQLANARLDQKLHAVLACDLRAALHDPHVVLPEPGPI